MNDTTLFLTNGLGNQQCLRHLNGLVCDTFCINGGETTK